MATYRATDPWDGPVWPVTWSLSGADSTWFQMNGNTLEFSRGPDYEHAQDEGGAKVGDNVYVVNLLASYARAFHSAPFPVSVAVTNVDEPGVVSVSPSSQPQVGTRLKASLTDPDGSVADTVWQWQHRAEGASSWTSLESQGVGSAFRPLAADAGQYLRATVTYIDGESSGPTDRKPAASVALGPVDPPGTVSLSPTSPEVGSAVTATLVDLDGTLSALAWQWQRRADASSAWVDIEPPSGARNPIIAAVSLYTPVTADVGKQLRATVTYTDGQGSGKSAQSAATAAVVGVPSVPGSFSASRGNGQVSLSWSAASSNESDIERYQTRYKTTSGGSWSGWSTVSGGASARSRTVSSLSNGTSYSFQVRAKNGVDYGSAAGASATPAGKPGTPGSFSASRGNGQVSLSWSAASSNGSDIERYQTRYSSNDGHTWSGWSTVSGGASARSRTVSSLSNGTSYSFQVRAKNGVDYGSAAGASATPAGKPGTPGSFSASRGNGQVSLSWSAASSNGSDIERYQTRYSSNDGHTWSGWSTVSGGASARSRTVSSLSNGTSYSFQVRAKNGVDYGSAAGASATPAEAPDPPTGVSVRTTGVQSLEVSWTPPDENGGSGLTGYHVRYCKTNEVSFCNSYQIWSSKSVSGGTTTSTGLTGLTANTQYTVQVRARNAAGNSGWSASATGRTQAGGGRGVTGAPSPRGPSPTPSIPAPRFGSSCRPLVRSRWWYSTSTDRS